MGRHHRQQQQQRGGDGETPEEGGRAPRPDLHISKSPKGWLPKKAAVVLLFLCLPRFIFVVGCCFSLAGMVLTICANSDNVRYDDKVAGPCLLVFGVLFAFSYVIWKNFRRKPAGESTCDGKKGNDNPAYGSNNNLHGRKTPQTIINIPAPDGSSAPAIQIQGPSTKGKKVQFKKTTQNANYLSTDNNTTVTASPVVEIKKSGRTKRNLSEENLKDITGISTMVEVHTEPTPGPSGTGSSKNGSIYTIPTIIHEDEDDDF